MPWKSLSPFNLLNYFPFYVFPKTSRAIINRFSSVVIPHTPLPLLLPHMIIVNNTRSELLPSTHSERLPSGNLGLSYRHCCTPGSCSPLRGKDLFFHRMDTSESGVYLLLRATQTPTQLFMLPASGKSFYSFFKAHDLWLHFLPLLPIS